MISFKRVYGVLIRHLATLRNPFELINYVYWTMLDVVIFGFMGMAMRYQSTTPCAQETATIYLLLTNVVLWYMITRGLSGIAYTLSRDLRDVNFVATFATPLSLTEWVIAALAMGTVASSVNVTTGILMVKLVFGFNVLSLGLPVIIALLLLLLCSWILGLFVTSLLIYWGKRIDATVHVFAWIFVPLSGVYYPLEVLPSWAQAIGNCLPMHYVFVGIHNAITGCASPYYAFGHAALVVIPLFLIVLGFFVRMFRASKRRGLTRLELEA